ncbi:hypothetical protein [Sphingobacterium lactis]|uniref:Outer membrane protein beta-barrel domain-containing protein n=1 Tax=Sphingobacterium lactis TaxID=797291 RepID=A0A1H5UPN9_9SPHI|nr:hypothetical protein [Sphingobacterium lactis]SEF76388.1 hypothetical protein SAMN05421877_102351 [Sphingobacterium lactis]
MKKIGFILLASLLSLKGFANEPGTDNPTHPGLSKKAFQTEDVQKHWFVGAGAGAQIFFGDHDKQLDFGDRLTPHFEIYGGKWLNDSFGVRLGLNGFSYKGATQTGVYGTGETADASQWLDFQKWNFLNVHADFMFNWTNDALGYDPNRMYNLIPYAGIGFGVVLSDPQSVKFSPNLGVLQSFRLNDKIDLTIDVRGNIYGDEFDGEIGGRNFEGAISTAVGVKYNINK